MYWYLISWFAVTSQSKLTCLSFFFFHKWPMMHVIIHTLAGILRDHPNTMFFRFMGHYNCVWKSRRNDLKFLDIQTWAKSAVPNQGLHSSPFCLHHLDALLYSITTVFRFEPPHDKTNKMVCVPSKDTDQPGHPPSLISLCCPHEAQADLSLCWVAHAILLFLSWGGSF